MNGTIYHAFLRTSALTLALLLLFDSGVLTPITRQISEDTQQYVATAVGVGASVKQTDINALSGQIAQRDRELDAREAAISEREIEIGLQNGVEKRSADVSTYILIVLLTIILILLVLNYVLDFIRERKRYYQEV